MKKFGLFSILMLALVVALPSLSFADTAASLTTDLMTVARGNIGILVGLGIAILGLWTWLISQNTWGIVMIIGGVALTAFPGIYRTAVTSFSQLFNQTGASGAQGTTTGAYGGSTGGSGGQ